VPLHRGIIQRYMGKMSGLLLDRIDLHIEVPAVVYQELRGKETGDRSAKMRERVQAARDIQVARRVDQRQHAARAVALDLIFALRWCLREAPCNALISAGCCVRYLASLLPPSAFPLRPTIGCLAEFLR
jgi:hypothetical protein